MKDALSNVNGWVTGCSGKCPCTKKDVVFTFNTAVADFNGTMFISLSTNNIGSLCGNRNSISFLFKKLFFIFFNFFYKIFKWNSWIPHDFRITWNVFYNATSSSYANIISNI